MSDNEQNMTHNAFELWRSELPGKSRSELKKELESCVKNRNVDKLKALLATVELSTDNGKGMFGSPPPGTLHPQYLNEALSTAAHNGHTELLRILVDAGADINHNGNHPLRNAAYSAHGDAMMELIKMGADVDNAMSHAGDSSLTRNALKIFAKLKPGQTEQATKSRKGKSNDNDSGWAAMGESCIAYTEGADKGPSLTMVFNFKAREVSTLVTAPGHNAPVTPAIRSFEEFGNAPLVREAEEQLVAARGGKPLKFRV